MNSICAVIYFLYVIGIVLTTFNCLKLSPSMMAWMERINNAGGAGIARMANLSDEKALRFFWQFFGTLGGISFILFFISNAPALSVSPTSRHWLAISWVLFFYMSGSIGRWSTHKHVITSELLASLKKRFKQGVIWGSIFSIVLIAISSYLVPLTSENWQEYLWTALTIITLSNLVLMVSLMASDGITLFLAYGPAILALLYLRLVIYAARISMRIGKNTFHNVLVIYFFIMTAYFTLLNFTNLMTAWHIGRLC